MSLLPRDPVTWQPTVGGDGIEYRAMTAELSERLTVAEQYIAKQRKVIDDAAAELARVLASRDRFQSNGKRLLAQHRQLQVHCAEMEAVIRFAEKPLLFAVHPDTGKAGTADARTEMTQKLMAIFVRIGRRG